MTVHTLPDRSTVRGQVAAEVRAEMGRQKISVNRLPHLIGKSQTFWQRRISGLAAMDVDDLSVLASLLDVPVTRFFESTSHEPHTPTDGKGSRQYHLSLVA